MIPLSALFVLCVNPSVYRIEISAPLSIVYSRFRPHLRILKRTRRIQNWQLMILSFLSSIIIVDTKFEGRKAVSILLTKVTFKINTKQLYNARGLVYVY